MKKIIILLIFTLTFVPKINAQELIPNAQSGILIESGTKEILYEKNKDEKVSVASLTKMMVQLLVLEKIEDKSINWDDTVVASANASGMGGTQIWLSTGEKMSVLDLFKGMSMASANDATVALAEYISGTEEEFVKLMNSKAKEIGMKNTTFKNSIGLDEDGHLSTAYDLAILASELVKHEEIFNFSSKYEDYIRTDTPNKYWLVNTNKLVRFYEGCDGLKTGFTDNAGYTMTVTAKRNNLRLIAVVLGEKEGKVRNNETMELLNYGFDNYKIDMIKSKDEVIKNIPINKGNKSSVNIFLKNDLSILSKKSDKDIKYDYEIKVNDIDLPIKRGEVVGKINLLNNKKIIKSEDLIIKEDLKKINFFKYILNKLIEVI
jgi:D-alanyl-D-alanine carboxypeptidase (penicillin-binding protein 5/6)